MIKAILLCLTAVASAVVSIGVFGAGIASGAPNFSGKTYSYAAKQIESWGAKVMIQTVVGDQLATDDCLVTGTKKGNFLDSSGRKSSPDTYLLDLNCNGVIASAGKAGASMASPDGQKAKKDLTVLAWLNKNPAENCAPRMELCKQLCTKYADHCSVDLESLVAA